MRQAPTTQQVKKSKQVLAKLKVWLLTGKSITHNEALKIFRTNRVSEYVRRLRNRGIKIYTIMESHHGDEYARYSIHKPKNGSRIHYS